MPYTGINKSITFTFTCTFKLTFAFALMFTLNCFNIDAAILVENGTFSWEAADEKPTLEK